MVMNVLKAKMTSTVRYLYPLPRPCFRVRSAPEDESRLRLRSEAEAPFRLLRLTLYGSAIVGGGVGLLVNLTQIAAAVAGRPGPTLPEAAKNIAVDLTAVALFGWLAWNEWKAREKQMKRLSRESRLGQLAFSTTTEKFLKVSDLRGSARVVGRLLEWEKNNGLQVVVAGNAEQIDQAMKEAEKYRELLSKAGVYIIAVPINGKQDIIFDADVDMDKRFKGKALRLDEWREWFKDQTAESSISWDNGLYVGLRLDGRVRASGKGCPPWFRISKELPPLEGIWKGFGDGFDGPVNM